MQNKKLLKNHIDLIVILKIYFKIIVGKYGFKINF